MSRNSSVKRKNPIKKSNSNVNNEFAYIEKELSEKLDTKVKVSNHKVEIRFGNANDLDRLLDLLNIKID